MNVFQFKNNGSEPGPAPAAGLVVVVGIDYDTTFMYSFDKDYRQDILDAVSAGKPVFFAYDSSKQTPDPTGTVNAYMPVVSVQVGPGGIMVMGGYDRNNYVYMGQLE